MELLTINNLWILVATCLVFLMHLGFAMLEAGFVQRKNVVNILFKNAMIIAIGLLTYYGVGFSLMYPGEAFAGELFGFAGFGLTPPEDQTTYNEGYTYWTDFIFQGMFAATAATIVSGAVAERIKLNSFLLFSVLLVALVYPTTGMWKWGGGWLDAAGFHDFAGSTLVHAMGGAAALAAALVLGPRKGKYDADGNIKPIPGHNMPLAAMGVFLLWFGWFGFNGGSVLSADPVAVSLVFVTTALAAAAGAVGAFIVANLMFKTHDLSMVLNGILGGLVGITAGADQMSPGAAIIIGFVAGCIIPLSVVFFDKVRVDDPVGATSVHLVCGIWGTLAVGLFGSMASLKQLWIQLYGCLSIVVTVFLISYGLMYAIKATIGLRVTSEEEVKGLDREEHEMEAYPGSVVKDSSFQVVR